MNDETNPTFADYINTSAAQAALDDGYGVTNWFTKGVPAAIFAGAAQVWNTAEWAANKIAPFIDPLVPEENQSRDLSITTGDLIRKTLGEDSTVAQYYDRHYGGVEAGGTFIGSLVAGGTVMKGVGMVQGLARGAIVTENAGLFTGLATNTLQQRYAIKAAEALASGQGYTIARLQTALAAAGQGAIEGVAFEVGAMAAFHQSPTYKDTTDFNSVLGHLATGAMWGSAGNAVFKYAGFLSSDFGLGTKLGAIKDKVGGIFNQASRVDAEGVATANYYATKGDALVSFMIQNESKAAPEAMSSASQSAVNAVAATKSNVVTGEKLRLYTNLAGEDANYLASKMEALPTNSQYAVLAGAEKFARPSTFKLKPDELYVNVNTGSSGKQADLLWGDFAADIKFNGTKVVVGDRTINLAPVLNGSKSITETSVANVHAAFNLAREKLTTVVNKYKGDLDGTIVPSARDAGVSHRAMGRIDAELASIDSKIGAATKAHDAELAKLAAESPSILSYATKSLEDLKQIASKTPSESNLATVAKAEENLAKITKDYSAAVTDSKTKFSETIDELNAAKDELKAEHATYANLKDAANNRTLRDYLTTPLSYKAIPSIEAQVVHLGQTRVIGADGLTHFLKGDDAIQALGALKLQYARELIAMGLPMESVQLRLNVGDDFLRGFTNSLESVAPKPLDKNTRNIVVGKYAEDAGVSIWDIKAQANVESRIRADSEYTKLVGASMLKQELPTIDISKLPTTEHRFNGAFTTTNAAYGSVLEQASRVGQIRQKFVEDLTTSRAAKFVAPEQALRSLGNGSAESQVIAALYGKIRQSASKFVLRDEGNIVERAVDTEGKVYTASEFRIADLLQQAFKGSKQEITPELASKVESNVMNWLKVHLETDSEYLRLANRQRLAKGLPKMEREAGEIYFPPPPASERKHMALVIAPDGTKSMILGGTKDLLGQKMREVAIQHPEFKILTKNDTEAWFKSLGEYEAESVYKASSLDQTMFRKGLMLDTPPPHGMKVLDLVNVAYSAKEAMLGRGAIETAYANELHSLELSALALNPEGTANAYTKLADTMLGITTPTKWHTIQSDIASGIDGLLNSASVLKRAHQTEAATSATEAYRESANKVYSAFNGKNAWESHDLYTLAGYQTWDGATQAAVTTANRTHRFFQLGFDYFSGIVNAIGTPILLVPEIRAALASNPEFPYLKLIGNAVQDYFKHPEYLAKYDAAGIVNKSLTAHRELMDATALISGAKTSEAALAAAGESRSLFNKVMDTLSTPTNWSERFTRYLAARVGHQIGEIQGKGGAELDAFIANFTNKVSANFTAGQRAKVFDGILGSSMGLFQTYQFNYMQQLFRHLEEGSNKTAAMMMALQGTTFGANSLPFFSLFNSTMIQGQSHDGTDAELATRHMLGEKLSDYLFYGIPSASTGIALYTRGGVTPRNTTVVPVTPQDLVLVQQITKYYNSLSTFASSMVNGGNLRVSGLEAIAHAGIARPLTGAAELMLGAKTSMGGDLDYSLQDDKLRVASAIRLLGAKPLDEALILDQYQRFNKLNVDAQAKRNKIAAALRTDILAGGEVDVEGFAKRYSKAGGTPNHFRQFYTHNLKAATTPRAELLAEKIRQSPWASSYQEMVKPEGIELFDPSK